MPQPENVRRRSTPGIQFQGSTTFTGRGFSNTVVSQSTTSGQGTQITVSEGHHWPPPKGELSDNGGNFFTTKQYVKTARSVVNAYYHDGDVNSWGYVGPSYCIIPGVGEFDFPPSLASSNAQLEELGATAISRCKPTNPPADVSNFLGELVREGIPHLIGSSLWKDKTEAARKMAGDEYLNVQFGWLPLVNGVKSIVEASKKADTVLAQYERDAGKVVRRRYRFPSKTTSSEDNLGPRVPWDVSGSGNVHNPSYGTLTRRRKTHQESWFSGAFTYALPSGYESRNALSKKAADWSIVYGLELTPETVWNLAPWSWAVDWFSNAGDVISNISDFADQGLIMRYGYVMEHTVTTDTYTLSGHPYRGTEYRSPPLTLVTETKVRRAANPFGFGVTWEGISPFQASIMAALGMTRGRR